MREFTNVHISALVTKEQIRNQIRNIGIYICTFPLFIEDVCPWRMGYTRSCPCGTCSFVGNINRFALKSQITN